MKIKLLHLRIPALLISILLINCSSSNEAYLSGSIDYIGNTNAYVEIPPLHYKYSIKEQYNLELEGGNFELSIPADKPMIVWLSIQDESYPIYIEPGKSSSITIKRAAFPFEVAISGDHENLNLNYQEYLEEINGLDAAIKLEMDKFKVGQKNSALAYSKEKLSRAEKYLKGTLFDPLYQKVVGEDLVLKLRAVEYSDRHIGNYDVDTARQKVIQEAVSKDFFSLDVLESQRAGIRDFTHYYSRTFGVYDSVVNAFQMNLAEYDIKQVAYPELDEKRMQVIEHIEDQDTKAYAEMFLVAERIGEQPFSISEPSYLAYLEDYAEFEEYTEFLGWFYNEIKSVSPGQPAVPFSISDLEGNIHTLSDYKGKFVLLDFWAGWCQPCLEEFPHMREIYSSYSRDDFEIVAISTEVDSLVWVQDITRFKNPWPQLYGGDGMQQETFKAYKGGGIPFYILVDPDGNISRYNDIRPSFNFTEVLDNLIEQYNNSSSTP
ncbi:MAG: TlpA family protein disulfide reductase [Balneola sp.]|nr:MAG: TlpA family protein disulfide reductase [Balneola sp.]